ncbi:MAG: hypothetical protein COV44_02645 [Deltaproteobacteria bacterium CG11_big_fil_rev_8_21_14_0_20_45_16]|nr:MAG: hypothetical protein COV44_02645 [Deltaproteobacteria bacterium CG11_big_fil_rev_8_21_14_0_20_45_16]
MSLKSKFLLGLFIFGLGTSLSLQAQDRIRLEAVAHFNKYASAEYNDCWGYTDANGREYALLGVRNGTSIIDITDPSDLREISFISSAKSIWKDIKTYQNYAYVVTDSSGWGMQILDLSGLPEKVELVNTYKKFTISHNLFIDTDRGILFAQGSHAAPVRILSLADPVNPVQISSFGVETHDMMARDGLVYVSEGGHGTIGIYDYNDPSNPKLVKRFKIQSAGYVHNAWLSDDGQHLMTTEETVGKTVKMFDLSDLNDVRLVGEYLAPSKLAHNTHIKGDYAYISHYGSGLRIIDVSDPTNLQEVAYFTKTDKENGSGYIDDWGAYPFFKSGKILVSDISDGLYVVEFDGAKE